MFRSKARIEKNLRRNGSELSRLREELRILAEQRVQLDEEAEDARLRSIVSDDRAAPGEFRESAKTAAAFKNDFEAKTARVAKLESRQDELLDKLRERAGRD
ncbi:MAG: hypothetical protein R2706_18865 [Acidimicrobiales bacterium]